MERPVGSVAVVITTYNDLAYLGEALDSVMAQTRPADEIIVVDDGSPQDPARVVAGYPAARLIRQRNQGLAAARNTGLRAAGAEAIVFLDADDRLLPRALELGTKALAKASNAAFAFGGFRIVRDGGQGGGARPAPARCAYADLLKMNRVGMHGAVTYRRQALLAVGGFDPAMRRCEDYDAYLRIAADREIATFEGIVADYRKHDDNMSNSAPEMLAFALQALDKQWDKVRDDPALAAAWREGRRTWTAYYGAQMPKSLKQKVRQKVVRLTPAIVRRVYAGPDEAVGWPAWGETRFGDLSRTAPICDDFGYGRGTPVDRGYIEAFLQSHADDIAGRALEVGDDAYCQRFGGGRVTRQDVLHVDAAAPQATIVGDLSQDGALPKGAFDCLVLTQTLHLIYDMAAAVRQMHQALKPGGSVLLTVPGITRIDRGEWGKSWYWSLTELSARALFEPVFGEGNVETVVYGNVFAATAFLQGLALEELNPAMLAQADPCFPVIIGVRARKGA